MKTLLSALLLLSLPSIASATLIKWEIEWHAYYTIATNDRGIVHSSGSFEADISPIDQTVSNIRNFTDDTWTPEGDVVVEYRVSPNFLNYTSDSPWPRIMIEKRSLTEFESEWEGIYSRYVFFWDFSTGFQKIRVADDWFQGPVVHSQISIPETGPSVTVLCAALGICATVRHRLLTKEL